MSNSFDPYQVREDVRPDLGPNYLKGLSADDNVMLGFGPGSGPDRMLCLILVKVV